MDPAAADAPQVASETEAVIKPEIKKEKAQTFLWNDTVTAELLRIVREVMVVDATINSGAGSFKTKGWAIAYEHLCSSTVGVQQDLRNSCLTKEKVR